MQQVPSPPQWQVPVTHTHHTPLVHHSCHHTALYPHATASDRSVAWRSRGAAGRCTKALLRESHATKKKKIFMLKKVKDTRILILTTPWHHIIWHNTRAWRGATSRYHKTTWHNTVTCFATTPEAATYHHLA